MYILYKYTCVLHSLQQTNHQLFPGAYESETDKERVCIFTHTLTHTFSLSLTNTYTHSCF